jgi:hypothetical protein
VLDARRGGVLSLDVPARSWNPLVALAPSSAARVSSPAVRSLFGVPFLRSRTTCRDG